MEIYLTFDDGIHAGTAEVLAVLAKMNASATFFLVGKEMDSTFKSKPETLLHSLREIHEKHAIGNHSYSHTNEKYRDYYENNGAVNGKDQMRTSVADDFDRGRACINHYLMLAYGKSAVEKVGNKPKTLLARLPGRNTSYFRTGTNPSLNKPYVKCELGTDQYAEQLFNQGYDVFGWNAEWTMTFDFKEAARVSYENPVGWEEMYLPENKDKDRLLSDWSVVMSNIQKVVEQQGKVVLLMHDRAFRNFPEAPVMETQDSVEKTEIPLNGCLELEELIRALQDQGAVFKTLDRFFD